MMDFTKTTAAMIAATILLAPAAHADDADVDTDWTGGHPLPEGTEVPHEPGYGSAWRMYDVIKFGDPNFRNSEVRGVRVIGDFDADQLLCSMNFKGGVGTCYVDGQQVTDLGWAKGGKLVTADAKIAPFTPIIQAFASLEHRLSSSAS